MQRTNLLLNYVLFAVLSVLVFVGWFVVRPRLFPPRPPAETARTEKGKAEPGKAEPGKAEPGKVEKGKGAEAKKPPVLPITQVPEPPPVTPESDLVVLGSDQADSAFHLGIRLDPRGAGVRRVVLNKFQAADRYGLPEWQNRKEHVPELLELVPDEANRRLPSNLLYHFDPNEPTGDRPLDTLGRARWEVVREGGQAVVEDTVGEGDQAPRRQRVSFRTEIAGVQITKTFTLVEREYHIGLEVKLRRTKDAADRKPIRFRYQLTGAHGLPIEGKWYTSIFRNALIAQEERGSVYRTLEDLRQIIHWEGGKEVRKQDNRLIRYAAVAVQYFASAVVVSNEQPEGQGQDFVAVARPTLEQSLATGTVKSVTPDLSRFILTAPDGGEHPFLVREADREVYRIRGLREGLHVTVVHHSTPGVYDPDLKKVVFPQIADRVVPEGSTHAVWEDDVTVRVATEPVELRPGEEVVHRYLLYNGPVKPSLLGQMKGNAQVPPAVVERYTTTLHLNTLTDYHSPGWLGEFSSTIYWTDLIIKCTNVMHWVLGHLHAVIPSYGLCILILTVLVRGLMFPVSRKQALTTLRMQELAPELKRLQERYKDDRQALGMAQMELYRRHGVNPFGTCWFLLLQMPIFMGLYFALQESIHFRLAEFWPTWIRNLAAPDMMIWWGEKIPVISRPESYGGAFSFLYLGPYFSLLPVIAVCLMLMQQKMMAPPATDEQQVMQQKMMRWMTVFFGLMFYKVAAGLCLYFIASSLWGFAERWLLPKKKLALAEQPAADGLLQRMLNRPAGEPSTAVTPAPGVAPAGVQTGARGRGRQGRPRRRDRTGREETTPTRPGSAAPPTDGSSLGRLREWWRERTDRLRDWWDDVLEQARKK